MRVRKVKSQISRAFRASKHLLISSFWSVNEKQVLRCAVIASGVRGRNSSRLLTQLGKRGCHEASDFLPGSGCNQRKFLSAGEHLSVNWRQRKKKSMKPRKKVFSWGLSFHSLAFTNMNDVGGKK